MAIAAHGDLDPRPVVLDAGDDVPQDPGRLFSRWPLAGAQQRHYRLARGRLEDVDGLETILVIMGVEQRQLLAAVDGVVGVVDIENNAFRHTGKAGTKQIDHLEPHARQRTPRRCVLKPRQGRLAHQVRARLGQTPTGQLEGRIETQSIKIITVLIAAGNSEQARPDHVGVSVRRACRVAFVVQARGQQVGKPEPSLDRGKQQNTAVRRQSSAVEPGAQFLALNR